MRDLQPSTLELLGRLVGVGEAKKLYTGELTPLFCGTFRSRAHVKLGAAFELVQRYLEEGLKRGDVLSNPCNVRGYLRARLTGLEHEVFVGLFLDTQHRLLSVEELARGTIDGASVYPREVVKRALRVNAAAVIFAHNHPSGVSEPSAADRALTDRLRQALLLIDIRVLDHIVVGGDSFVSFAERGWI